MKVSTSVLQNNFGKYLKHAENGIEITITKNNQEVAVLKGVVDPYKTEEIQGLYQAKNRMTYEEFLEIDEEDSRYELIDGYIYLQAAPKYEHQYLVRELTIQLHYFLKGSKCEAIFAPFDVTLYRESIKEPSVVQPDILVICDKENINEKGEYLGVPTLVIEILSPSNRSYDMIKKLDLYKATGISEYWIVDPKNQSILIYHFEKRDVLSCDGYHTGDICTSKAFSKLQINMDELFLDPK